MIDKKKSSKIDKSLDKSSPWNAPLRAACEELETVKQRIGQLRASIRIFEQKISSGAPYP